LPEDIKVKTLARLKAEFTEFLGRRVANLDRTDGLKIAFADGSWVLLRLSGTEPLLRIYTEAATPQAASQLAAETAAWVGVQAPLGTHQRKDTAQGAQA
jgi:phosphomannomutase